MIGTGKAHVHTVVEIAQAQCQDGFAPEAVQAFASLGGWGSCSSKEERDLHTWLKNLHDIQLEVYHVNMTLQVIRLNYHIPHMVWDRFNKEPKIDIYIYRFNTFYNAFTCIAQHIMVQAFSGGPHCNC